MAATGGGEAYVSTQGTGRGAILSLVTPEPEIVPPLKRTVTIGRMVVLAFALTAMGPFGIEVCVGAAGPLYTLIALIGLPFVWAVPQALMTAELSTMIPENGGYILWVRDAYGPFLGWINAWNCTFSNLFDNAVYVVLFVAYLPYDLTPLEQWYIKAAVILVVMALNLRGLEAVTAVSVVLTMAVCAPFLIMFAARVSDVRPIQWLYLPSENHVIAFEDIDFGLFLSVALWAYTGWDSLGSFAGEVVDPYRTYPRGVAITLVINVLLYVLPILTGLTFSAKSSAWTDGYFTDVARMITPWLGAWVVVAAMISNLAQYNAAIACTSRALWSMGRPENRMLPSVVGFTWERYGTPAVAIVLLNLSSLVLVVFDFSVLIQVDTFLNCLTLMMEFASFLRFRYRDPDRARPFRVPGGMAGAWLITVPKVLVVGATLAMADSLTLLISAGINAFIIILYLVVYVCRRTCTCCSSEDGDGSGDGDVDRVRLLPR